MLLGHNQSGDAIIEEVNKDAKRDVVGVPSAAQWKRSFRNLDNMNKLRSATFYDAGIRDTKNSSNKSRCDKQKEAIKIRAMIRKMKYLENPREPSEHTNIMKSLISSENLVKFSAIAYVNRRKYIANILNDVSYKTNIVYTKEDEQEENTRIEKSTVTEIKENILSMLHTLPNNELLMNMYKKEVANKDKGT